MYINKGATNINTHVSIHGRKQFGMTDSKLVSCPTSHQESATPNFIDMKIRNNQALASNP